MDFTTLGKLESYVKQQLLEKMVAAVENATDKSFELLQRNVNEFYSIPEGKYHRTGQLQASPRCEGVSQTKDGAIGQISISTGTQYWPAGRDTEWIYQIAESGGLIGKGGFWEGTESKIQKILDSEIAKICK